MTQFHEGQDVEVWCSPGEWERAKIVVIAPIWGNKVRWLVQFTDGTRAVFDSEHIRDPKVGKAMYEHAAKLADSP